MSTKEQLHRLVDSLPEGPEHETIEELHYRLYVLEKVRKGIAEIDAGQGVTDEDAGKELAQWLVD